MTEELKLTALLPHQIIMVGHYTGGYEHGGVLKITEHGAAVGKTVSEAQKIWPQYKFYNNPDMPVLIPIFEEKFNFLGDS